MTTPDEEGLRLRSAIDHWRDEALIAEEQGDEEQARKYFELAEKLERTLGLPTPASSRPSRR
jgi:hypothetical protein